MDAAVTSVAVAALVADGILAGLSLDKVIVQLPAGSGSVWPPTRRMRGRLIWATALPSTRPRVWAPPLTLAAFAVAAGLTRRGQ